MLSLTNLLVPGGAGQACPEFFKGVGGDLELEGSCYDQ